MGRSPCCSKVGLRRGPWSTKEDSLLANFIQQNGEGQWRSLPKKAGLLRCGKSCRLRWMNYLRPGIKRGNISADEEDLIIRLHGLLGNRWSLIAGRLPGRTDNEIKNYWNTHLLKKLNSKGINTNNRKRKLHMNRKPPKQEESNKEMLVAIARPPTPKTKVYLPKPTRVSPPFSRTTTTSNDSFASDSDAIDAPEKTAAAEVVSFWPPIYDTDCVADDFLAGAFVMPLLNHSDLISGDAHALEEVYDQYLQLL